MASPHEELGPILLGLARDALREGLETNHLGQNHSKRAHAHELDPPALQEPGACFVTLTRKGQLRGCIGHLQPCQTLGEDVRENTLAAAFHDSRFAPLEISELEGLHIEVSVLGPACFEPCPTKAICLRRITPFQDGVILRSGWHQATFLPQVWEDLPQPENFIAHLLRKGHFPEEAWPPDMELGRYRVEVFTEPDTT